MPKRLRPVQLRISSPAAKKSGNSSTETPPARGPQGPPTDPRATPTPSEPHLPDGHEDRHILFPGTRMRTPPDNREITTPAVPLLPALRGETNSRPAPGRVGTERA